MECTGSTELRRNLTFWEARTALVELRAGCHPEMRKKGSGMPTELITFQKFNDGNLKMDEGVAKPPMSELRVPDRREHKIKSLSKRSKA
jgi:hypothetical protein